MKGAVDLGSAPGGVVCAVGVDPTLVYRRIYGAFNFLNCSWDCKLQFRGLFQNQEVFLIDAQISSASETLPSTTPTAATTRGWLGFSIETQPAALGFASTIPAPVNSVRFVPVSTETDTLANIVTASPFEVVGRWDRIEARLVPNSGNSCIGGLGSTTATDVWIACLSSNLKP
ncbi:MAG: hypothetical protein DVB31_05425 [Verrucomicrobia bacterium]|nr:MAG: hypothetical protein DVB31_05425 [Verrucomicrobiota bacterium]